MGRREGGKEGKGREGRSGPAGGSPPPALPLSRSIPPLPRLSPPLPTMAVIKGRRRTLRPLFPVSPAPPYPPNLVSLFLNLTSFLNHANPPACGGARRSPRAAAAPGHPLREAPRGVGR